MSSDEGKPATADGTEDANKEKHVFAAPAPRPPGGGSLLGLDRLAREKRAANQAKESAARKRTSMMEDDELGGGGGNDDDRAGPSTAAKSAFNPSKRQFRGHRVETPSHPGGLNEEARREIDERRKDRNRGVTARSQHRGRDRSRDRDHHRGGGARDGDRRRRGSSRDGDRGGSSARGRRDDSRDRTGRSARGGGSYGDADWGQGFGGGGGTARGGRTDRTPGRDRAGMEAIWRAAREGKRRRGR